jgi:diguanylate cyclase (GGDEF)-like protein/PAS domain S-box-containing protein
VSDNPSGSREAPPARAPGVADRWWVVLLPVMAGSAIAAVVAVVAFTLWSTRQSAIHVAEVTTRNLALVLESETVRTLQAGDATLASVTTVWAERPAGQSVDPQAMHRLLREKVRSVELFRALYVLDARGRMIHDSEALPARGLDLSDREYFQVHLKGDPGLHVSNVIRGRLTGAWSVVLTRRLVDAYGRFEGIVVGVLDPGRFEQAYRGLDIGKHGLINLRHVEGELIARVPPRENAVGQKIASTPMMLDHIRREGIATGELRSVFDRINRIYTARVVQGTPFLVFVGVCKEEALAAWSRSAIVYGAAAMLLVASLGWLSHRLLRELRRRDGLMVSVARSESLLRQILESLPVGVYVARPDGETVVTNPVAKRIWGQGDPDPGDAVRVRRRWNAGEGASPGGRGLALSRALSEARTVYNQVVDLHDRDGRQRTVLTSAAPIVLDSGEVFGAVEVSEDITAQRDLVETLRATEARYRALFENSIDAIVVLGPDGTILAANPGACDLLGYDEAELRKIGCRGILADASATPADLAGERARTGRATHEIVLVRKDGSRFPAEVSASLFPDRSGGEAVSLIVRDVTQRKQAEARIEHLAYHDELTGLPNRALFNETLRRLLAQSRRHGRSFAVMLLDLDGFKRVNDTLGHEVGDQLLQEVSVRFRHTLRAGDVVARLGGDEFILLVEEPGPADAVATLARKLLHAIAQPYRLGGQELHLTASLGISIYPRDGEDPRTLLRHSDLAMYRAKETGRNGFVFFSEALNASSQRRLAVESVLRRALDGGFVLHYQPKFDLATGRLTGSEALLRLCLPDAGEIGPAEFIPIAEETGLIVPIGAWAMASAARQQRAWIDAGLDHPRVAVNLSARQLAHQDLARSVRAVLEEAGLAAEALEVEVTESTVMHDADAAAAALARLKDMGVRITVDDFGTGYSSLSYLKRFPIECVKIDGTFVRELPHGADDVAITRGILAMAHSLRLRVVAEGVETREQLEFLRGIGCDEGQGFLFGRPMPADALGSLATSSPVLTGGGVPDDLKGAVAFPPRSGSSPRWG